MSADQGEQKVWTESFNAETRVAQRREDSDAWYAVTGLLLTIITIGVTLAACTVWICTNLGAV